MHCGNREGYRGGARGGRRTRRRARGSVSHRGCHLKSNVSLHVVEGATFKFIPEPAKYPPVLTRWEGVEAMNYSPLIYAFEQENIAITGKGTLDGSASLENWWGWNRKQPGEPTL